MYKTHVEAEAALKATAEIMKQFYNRKRNEARPYKRDDLVYINLKNIKTIRSIKKLDDKRYRPFKIIALVSNSTYQMRIPKSWKIHNVFNKVVLTSAKPSVFETQTIDI